MKKKVFKGWELIKAIENGEIKDQTKIKTDCGDIFIYDKEDATFYWEKRLGGNRVPIHTLLIHTFELIEEQQDIDGEELEERIENLKKRIEKLEKSIDRFEYFAKRVEEIDASKGIFRYC